MYIRTLQRAAWNYFRTQYSLEQQDESHFQGQVLGYGTYVMTWENHAATGV
jgi:hypothetical protein